MSSAALDRDTMDALSAPSGGVRESFAPGVRIAGKYEIERELGAGGVGVVALARHIELGHRVAIKYLRSGSQASPQSIERFKREAKLAASLRSEHVVRVIDVGTTDGMPYMVMEYLEGEDLGEVLKRGVAPVEQAVQWTLQACHALEEAHELGIVHRDLKPANFFLATRANGPPVVKILDFGISKVTERTSLVGLPAMTRQDEIFGTPYYMSPEQLVSSSNVDARSDVWAMGVCLYELLTGRLPFEGDDLRQLVADVLSSVPTPIRDYRPDIPIELAQQVHACLSYDPAQRPRSAADLARNIRPFASERYVSNLALAETSLEVSGLHDLGWVHQPAILPEPPRRSRFGLFVGIGVTSLLAGAALVVAVTRTPASRGQSLVGAEASHDVVVALPSSATAAPALIEIIEVKEALPIIVAPTAPSAPRRAVVHASPVRSAKPVDEFGGRE